MNLHNVFFALCILLPVQVSADDLFKVTGKNTSNITAYVPGNNNLVVTDMSGGWSFENGLEMVQLGGRNSPFKVEVKLKVISTSGKFQVRTDGALVISHQENPEKMFRSPKVTFAAENMSPQVISDTLKADFQNPPGEGNQDSTGVYTLEASAYAPEGSIESTAGNYSGVLNLIFEPVVVKQ